MGRRKQILPEMNKKSTQIIQDLDVPIFELVQPPTEKEQEEYTFFPFYNKRIERRGRKQKFPPTIKIEKPEKKAKVNGGKREKKQQDELFIYDESLFNDAEFEIENENEKLEEEETQQEEIPTTTIKMENISPPNSPISHDNYNDNSDYYDNFNNNMNQQEEEDVKPRLEFNTDFEMSTKQKQVKNNKRIIKQDSYGEFLKIKGKTCPDCPHTIFPSLPLLTKHRKEVHGLGLTKRRKRCGLCFHLFFDHYEYRRHMRLHAGESPHFCPRCPAFNSPKPGFNENNEMKFRLFSEWLNHLETRHKTKVTQQPQILLPFVCTFQQRCYKHFSTEAALAAHLKSHDKKKNPPAFTNSSVSSSGASKSTTTIKSTTVKTTMETKIPSSKTTVKKEGKRNALVQYFKCDRPRCGKWIRGNSKLALHKEFHERQDKKAQRKFPCDSCPQIFKCKSLLNAHLRSHRQLFHCQFPGCEKSFVNTKTLNEHSRLHTLQNPFECSVKNCALKFQSKSQLTDHLKNHPSQKKYACKICDESFEQGSQLRKHTTTAHEELQISRVEAAICPFPECRKVLEDPIYMKNHMLTHSNKNKGRKPFLCNRCEAPFATENSRNLHQSTHKKLGISQVSCPFPLCGKSFKKPGFLSHHIQIFHKGAQKPDGNSLNKNEMELLKSSGISGAEEEFDDYEDYFGREDDDFQLDQNYEDDEENVVDFGEMENEFLNDEDLEQMELINCEL